MPFPSRLAPWRCWRPGGERCSASMGGGSSRSRWTGFEWTPTMTISFCHRSFWTTGFLTKHSPPRRPDDNPLPLALLGRAGNVKEEGESPEKPSATLSSSDSSSSSMPSGPSGIFRLPLWDEVQPHHVAQFIHMWEKESKEDPTGDTSSTSQQDRNPHSVDSTRGDRMDAMTFCLQQWVVLLYHWRYYQHDPSTTADWRRALEQAAAWRQRVRKQRSEPSTLSSSSTSSTVSSPSSTTSSSSSSYISPLPITASTPQLESECVAALEQKLAETEQFLVSVYHQRQQRPSSHHGKEDDQLVTALQTYRHIRHQLARSQGPWSDHVDRLWQTQGRMASREQLHVIHQELARAWMPSLLSPLPPSLPQPNKLVSWILGPLVNTSTKAQEARPGSAEEMVDRRIMLRLEDHVTLEKALQVCFQLCRDWFGIRIEPGSADPRARWDPDVRVFHIYDQLHDSLQPQLLGTWLLDPFSRRGKWEAPMTVPLIARYHNLQVPVYGVALSLPRPSWDTDPAMVTWDDMATLLHELGHVLQDALFFDSPYGAWCGPQPMPWDLSEFLPKLMEHLLWEPSTLSALLEEPRASNSTTKSSKNSLEEQVQAAFREHSRDRARLTLQHAFYGALELEFLSWSEEAHQQSLLDMQQRIAQQFTAHDMPDRHDLSPLLKLVYEQYDHRPAAYRYVWCDVLSAAILQIGRQHSRPGQRQLPTEMRRFLSSGGAVRSGPHGSYQLAPIFGVDLASSPLSAHALIDRYSLGQRAALP